MYSAQELKLNTIYDCEGTIDDQDIDEELVLPVLHADQCTIYELTMPTPTPAQPEIRSSIHDSITHLFKGDSLSTDYLLAFLFSSPPSKEMPLPGASRVNFVIKDAEPSFFDRVLDFIEGVMPLVAKIGMSIEGLNRESYASKMIDGVLSRGILQLPKSSILMVDETSLNPGTLSSTGLSNITQLKSIVRDGEIEYGLEFGSVSVGCEISCCVVSEGKSMLDIDIVVPVVMADSTDSSEWTISNLPEIRSYISSSKKLWSEYSINESVAEQISDAFVNRVGGERVLDKETNGEDLGRILGVARGLSLWFGCSELSWEVFVRAVEMESERVARLRLSKGEVEGISR